MTAFIAYADGKHDLINISNKIAEQLEVTHQSPQLIVLENGKATKNASHSDISVSLL